VISTSDLTVRLVRPRQLTVAERELWWQLQAAEPEIDGPFFCLEFIEAVAATRGTTEVAVIERDGQTVGFFPFQRSHGNVGRPVLSRLSEFQGLVAGRDLAIDAMELLRQCGLVAWHFDHLVAAQACFKPYHWNPVPSPYMDLSSGYDAYQAGRREAGSQLLINVARKSRKIERELGPLRFEYQSRDPAVFQTLVEWKSQQHERTQRFRVLDTPWLIDFLEALWRIETPRFAGVLSALYAGDTLTAVHFGPASATSLHLWFPAFNPEHGRYSPGLILLAEMARTAAGRGLRRLDLGKGPERYKVEFASGAAILAEGSLDTRMLHRWARHSWHRTKQWMRTAPAGSLLARPLEWSRRWRQQRGFKQ